MVVLIVAIVVVVVGIPFAIFNRLVHLRNMVRESWRDIDTELQRRYDLIPNLVSTVKGYAAHEREVFDSVTTLRTAAMAEHGPPDAQAPREQALGHGVAQLMAVAEQYPDLKASQGFLALQQELVTPRTASRSRDGSTTPTCARTTHSCRRSRR